MKTNRKCLCCGKEYYFCPSCETGEQPAYLNSFDSENCANIFKILVNHSLNKITALEAKSQLNKCEVSAIIDTIDEDAKAQIKTILNTVEKPVNKIVGKSISKKEDEK